MMGAQSGALAHVTRRSEFLSGAKAELPILLGVAPFGMIYGALAMAAGLPVTMAQAMSSVVFAGSAQFIAVQLISQGAPALVLLVTTVVVNIRHMLYSASVAPYLRPLRPGWKWLLAYLLTDEAYAIAILHYQQTDAEDHHRDAENAEDAPENPARLSVESAASPSHPVTPSPSHPVTPSPGHPATLSPDHSSSRHWYLLGAGLALWTTWQISTAIGIFLGAAVPPSWSLDFALPLTFIALLAPILKDRPTTAAALAAGVVAVIGAGWPYKLGLVVAALAGIAAGAWVEKQADNGTTAAKRPR
jgi:predicted branched-subunit amino acid permease